MKNCTLFNCKTDFNRKMAEYEGDLVSYDSSNLDEAGSGGGDLIREPSWGMGRGPTPQTPNAPNRILLGQTVDSIKDQLGTNAGILRIMDEYKMRFDAILKSMNVDPNTRVKRYPKVDPSLLTQPAEEAEQIEGNITPPADEDDDEIIFAEDDNDDGWDIGVNPADLGIEDEGAE